MFIQCQNYMEPENIDIDIKIKFLSPLFAEIWGMEKSHRPFWKLLPQTPQSNIITIFGLCDPENKDKYTQINFLSILFAEIILCDIDNSCHPF